MKSRGNKKHLLDRYYYKVPKGGLCFFKVTCILKIVSTSSRWTEHCQGSLYFLEVSWFLHFVKVTCILSRQSALFYGGLYFVIRQGGMHRVKVACVFLKWYALCQCGQIIVKLVYIFFSILPALFQDGLHLLKVACALSRLLALISTF